MRVAAWFLCLVILLFAAACSRSSKVAQSDGGQCAQEGGERRRVCMSQTFECVRPFSDAGKPCRDSSECEGECWVDLRAVCYGVGQCTEPAVPEPGTEVTGVCQSDNDPCGSFVFVRNGRALPIEHRD